MGAMAGKDDIFIIGAESPAGEGDGEQDGAQGAQRLRAGARGAPSAAPG